MKVFTSLLVFVLVVKCCESSYLKSVDAALPETEILTDETTEQSDFTSAEASTETATEIAESSDSFTNLPSSEIEITNSDETQHVDMRNGQLFQLKMTIFEKWNDDFMDTSSEAFKNLARTLGSELMDYIDNSQEANQPNITTFQLVEVQPSQGSIENVYVTFIISSPEEISGKDMADSLSNRIILYGEIYVTKATIDGFALQKITEKELEMYSEAKVLCHSGERHCQVVFKLSY